MSSYEDYADASKTYDSSRIAVGPEVILGHLVTGPAPLPEVRLLDAGCGTGNYAKVIAPHIGAITLVDASADMLARAEAKLASTPGATVAGAHHARLQDLPFEDASFDAIMTNQVLHHLEPQPDEAWPEHRQVFAEFARVLRPGGVLLVNTCSHEQVRHGYWGYSLMPQGQEATRRRYAPLEVLEDAGAAVGLDPVTRYATLGAPIQGDAYFDPKGPLRAEWRRGDSAWSLAPADEVAAAEEKVRSLDASGELDAYVAEHDAQRPHIGQTVFAVFRRQSGPS